MPDLNKYQELFNVNYILFCTTSLDEHEARDEMRRKEKTYRIVIRKLKRDNRNE